MESSSRRTFLHSIAALGALGTSAGTTWWFLFVRPRADVSTIKYDTATEVDHAGSIFVPARARSEKRPLLLLLDPSGGADIIVTGFVQAAKRFDWIVASSSHIRNGTPDESDRAELAGLRAKIRETFLVDDDHVYLGGLSGGACTAYQFAVESPDEYRGAIVACGHMGPWRRIQASARGTTRSSFYLFTRDGDFNRAPTQKLRDEMTAKGYRVTYVEHHGGHSAMTAGEAEEAVAWMDAGA